MQRNTFTNATPGFVAHWPTVRRNSGRQIDWAAVPADYRETPGQTVTVAAGGALAGATALPVNAIGRAIPSGTTIVFDAAAGEYATLSADAAAGATSLTVQPLATTFEGGETGVIEGQGKKVLKAGTPVAEIDATGLLVPRGLGAATAGRTTVGVLTSDAHEPGYGGGTQVEALSGYGVITGAVVYEQLLPETPSGASVLDATVRTELRDLPGGGFAFEQYSDNRAS